MSEQAHAEHFTARWADLDANRHLRNTVFSAFATHTRFRLLEAHGFPQSASASLRFGPVMFREEIRYRREVRFWERITVNVLFAGLAEDGSRWRVRQDVRREDGRPGGAPDHRPRVDPPGHAEARAAPA